MPATACASATTFPPTPRRCSRPPASLKLEGVIAKRRDGLYTSSRSTDWLKLKCQARQEFVIGGFSDRSDNAKAVGALMLGYYDDQGVLQYAGRVGTGWSSADAVDAAHEAGEAGQRRSRRSRPAPRARRAGSTKPAAEDHWVKPQLVAEISFAEWTPDGSVRHASYQGLREDKDAKAVGREKREGAPDFGEGRDREEEDARRGDVGAAAPAAKTGRPRRRRPAPPRSRACASRTPSA